MSNKMRSATIAGAALIALLLFVGLAALRNEIGFPLDDSWIHQTYARNLAEFGKLQFIPGQTSTGSTAPLWTFVLAAGYLVRIPHFWWTFFVSWICLTWVGWSGGEIWRLLWPAKRHLTLFASLALVFSWPMVWAVGSGMETLLFIALALHILTRYLQGRAEKRKGAALLGFLTALLILTRPEGAILLALLTAAMIVKGASGRQGLSRLLVFGAGVIVLLVPYFYFNWRTSGEIWPNTFYAKQTEYAVLYRAPLLSRFVRLLYFSVGGPAEGLRGLSGAHWLLIPGLLVAVYKTVYGTIKVGRIVGLLPLIWAGAHVFAFAWRLPVIYHHGRYLFPAVAVWILYGLAGWSDILGFMRARLRLSERGYFVLSRVSAFSFCGLLAVFLLLGAQTYLADVAFINGEMVATAQWINDNTEEEDVIAAHDIGALGYFAGRPLLDLAGLITPEVIPLLDNDAALSKYVLDSEANYLVTAPGWTYGDLVALEGTIQVFTTDYLWTRLQGSNNISVYRLP